METTSQGRDNKGSHASAIRVSLVNPPTRMSPHWPLPGHDDDKGSHASAIRVSLVNSPTRMSPAGHYPLPGLTVQGDVADSAHVHAHACAGHFALLHIAGTETGQPGVEGGHLPARRNSGHIRVIITILTRGSSDPNPAVARPQISAQNRNTIACGRKTPSNVPCRHLHFCTSR